ncbi:MAG: hypothetical protein Q8P20_07050 [bacterium]|nr:hypothetical protein [bacterium]
MRLEKLLANRIGKERVEEFLNIHYKFTDKPEVITLKFKDCKVIDGKTIVTKTVEEFFRIVHVEDGGKQSMAILSNGIIISNIKTTKWPTLKYAVLGTSSSGRNKCAPAKSIVGNYCKINQHDNLIEQANSESIEILSSVNFVYPYKVLTLLLGAWSNTKNVLIDNFISKIPVNFNLPALIYGIVFPNSLDTDLIKIKTLNFDEFGYQSNSDISRIIRAMLLRKFSLYTNKEKAELVTIDPETFSLNLIELFQDFFLSKKFEEAG